MGVGPAKEEELQTAFPPAGAAPRDWGWKPFRLARGRPEQPALLPEGRADPRLADPSCGSPCHPPGGLAGPAGSPGLHHEQLQAALPARPRFQLPPCPRPPPRRRHCSAARPPFLPSFLGPAPPTVGPHPPGSATLTRTRSLIRWQRHSESTKPRCHHLGAQRGGGPLRDLGSERKVSCPHPILSALLRPSPRGSPSPPEEGEVFRGPSASPPASERGCPQNK